MSDYEFPELPSDEELGITDEDREKYEEALGDAGPELSAEEMKALLGDDPAAPRSGGAGEGSGKAPAADGRAARKAARKAEKDRKKEEKRRAKEEKLRAKEAKKAAKAAADEAGDRPETDAERAERVARALGSSGGATSPPPPSADGGGGSGGGGDGGRADAEPAGASGGRWRGPVTLVALVALAIAASSRTGLPRPQPANAPETAFASARAMSMLVEIGTEAHPPGSPRHARVRDYLTERLRGLGLEPEIQTTTSFIQGDSAARVATVRNIVARLPGADPTGAVLLTAHYDGREISPSASDDAVGVVTILEALRASNAMGSLTNDVIVLLTDAEELGLLGARAFVDQHPLMDDVSIILSFEMRGSAGPAIMFETNALNGWIVGQLAAMDASPFANSMSQAVYDRMPRDTDFTPFKEAGVQGMNFASIGNGHVYHQAFDEPSALDEKTVQHQGESALAALRQLGEADLRQVDAPDVVYFTLPGLGLVSYDRVWSMALSGALLLLLAGAVLLARRSGAGFGRVGVGLVVGVVAVGIAFAAATALLGWLPRFHPEDGALMGSRFHEEGGYVLAFVLFTFTSVAATYAIARRWLGPVELALGAVILPVLAAVVVGFVEPLGAPNLQWPALAALLAVSASALLGERRNGVVGWLATLLLAAPVVLFLTPVVELVWHAFGIDIAPWLMLLVGGGFFFVLPAVESLRSPNVWWAPASGFVMAAAAVGVGLLMSRSNAERPVPTTLLYAYEHGTGAAVWASDPTADSTDAEATAWAVERAGGSFDGVRDLSGFAYLSGQIPTTPASVVSAQPPEVVIARDTIAGPTRRVTLRVRSRIGAEMLAFVPDSRGATRVLSVSGHALERPGEMRRIEHWGEPDPTVVLELEMPAADPIGIHVVEHLLRPRELLGDAPFRRPPHMAPNIMRGSDRAMFRYSVAAFADPRAGLVSPGSGTLEPVGAALDSLSAGVGGDSVAEPDSAGGVGDSIGAATDTIGVVPDTGGGVPDTGGVSIAPPDTVPFLPGTIGAGR